MEDRIQLSPPPRRIKFGIRLKLYFGGVFTQIGWAIAVFGLLFCWGFSVDEIFRSMYYFSGQIDQSEGVVVNAFATKASVNDSPVMQIEYTYHAYGIEYTGKSYATGEYFEKDSKVAVEYPYDKPEYSRIVGMRASMFSWEVSFLLIIPLVGLIFGLVRFITGIRILGFMKTGYQAFGRVVKKELTNVYVNNVPVKKLTFEFVDHLGKKYRFFEKATDIQEMVDEAQECLIYDPKNPEKAKLIDNLPKGIAIDQYGNFRLQSGRMALSSVMLLMMPAFSFLILYNWFF